MSARALALGLVVAMAAAPARADDREARARAHYEVGLGMYHLGNYADAAREFSAGYELSHRPQFLVNLGQAYRKLGELDEAAEMFRRYLETAPPDAPDRQEVQDILREVETARRPPPATTAAPSTTTSTAPTPPTASTPSTSSTVASPSLAVTTAPPPHKSALRRFWWTIPVGAVVVGTAVGLGLYFGLSHGPCAGASIGCYDLRQ